MRARIGLLTTLGFVGALAVGCGTTAPARFYTLDSPATAGVALPAPSSVMIGSVAVPASVDQPQFVVQVAANRVEIDEFNRWAAPLNDSIARAVAGDLAAQLGTPNVATTRLPNFNPDYVVTIEVQRFESTRGKTALIDAVWSVRKTTSGETLSGRTTTHEDVQGDTFDALAAAHSRALATVSSDIATTIRAEANEKQ
jgi:uncharacterized lipoprotein YmbA